MSGAIPLRLLFVIDNLGSGGAQRQMVNLALGLRARGHEVEFFCYWPQNFFAQRLADARIPVHLHVKAGRYALGVVHDLRGVLRRGVYDAALAFQEVPNLYLLLAAAGLRRRPQVVVSERSYDPPEGVGWRQRLPRWLYRSADHVTVNSHHQRAALERKLPWIVGKSSTIYNGVDLAVFQPRAVELPSAPLRLLAVASVSPCKNGLCLIEALRILAQRDGLFPCVNWVGDHDLRGERAAYIGQMRAAISAHGLERQWAWLYERDDVPELMTAHHALVHASYGEGLPNVVCEALASGLPVIISDTLDHPRLVEHGVSGYLFDWRDPNDLARQIKALAELPEAERAAMGRRGRAFAEAHLALPILAGKYEELFRALTG